MIRIVRAYAPPAPPPLGERLADQFAALKDYLINRVFPWQFNYINDLVSAFNTGPQGEGASIASAATIGFTSFIHHVTGTTTVTTISVPSGLSFAGLVCLIADNGLTFGTGGNIATSKTLAANQMAILAYSQRSQLWFHTA